MLTNNRMQAKRKICMVFMAVSHTLERAFVRWDESFGPGGPLGNINLGGREGSCNCRGELVGSALKPVNVLSETSTGSTKWTILIAREVSPIHAPPSQTILRRFRSRFGGRSPTCRSHGGLALKGNSRDGRRMAYGRGSSFSIDPFGANSEAYAKVIPNDFQCGELT